MRKRVVSPDAAPQSAARAVRAGAFACVFLRPGRAEPSPSSIPFPATAPGTGAVFYSAASAVLALLATVSLLTASSVAAVSPAAASPAAAADAIRSAHGRTAILAQGRGGPDRRSRRCLSRQEQRARLATKAVVPLSKLARAVEARGGELLRARLCRNNGGLVYLLTILGPGGKVRRSVVDARTGKAMGGPR